MDASTVLLSVIAGLLTLMGGLGLFFLRDVKADIRELRVGMNDALHGISDLLRTQGERISAGEARGYARDERMNRQDSRDGGRREA